MTLAFSPTQITFDGFGSDDNDAKWVRFCIPDLADRRVAVPLAELNISSPELWRRLGDAGVVLSREDQKALFHQVRRQGVATRIQFKVVRQIGWSWGRFVYPDRVFGAPNRLTERAFGNLDMRKYRSSGTLQEWQTQVASLCSGNSRLIFAIATAFAGPLLEVLGLANFGFSFVGDPSSGKTTLLMIAGSVLGCRVGAGARRGFLES